jgi:hypothetical protein
MDIIKTATEIAQRFNPFFGKSKTIKDISTEIGQAADNELAILWSNVKPWFIKEYAEEIPIDDSFEAEDVKSLIKSELKKADEVTKAAIEKALVQTKATTNITQNHSGSGDNVAGDKVVNSNSKIGQQNNNSTVNNGDLNFDF